MPASVELQRNDRLAIVTWSNPVIHEDFMNVFSIMEPVYIAAKLPVYSIYMAIGLTNLPPRAISTYLRDKRSPLVHPMSGTLIVVSQGAFIRAMVDTAAKMSPPNKLKTAQTLEEAMTKIEAALEKELNV
jgi:hypothetical protein